MMNDAELCRLPGRRGEARYFHHVYISKTRRLSDRSGNDDQNLKIEGKPRRMLILKTCFWCDLSSISETDERTETNDCVWYRAKGQPGYLVVPLVSECPKGLEAWHSTPYSGILDEGKNTVIAYIPAIYPAENCCHGKYQAVKKFSPGIVDDVVKQLGLRGLGFDPQVLSARG